MKKLYENFATEGGDLDVGDVGELFRSLLQEKAREYIIGVMLSEVEFLCGPRGRRHSESEWYRSGSAPGYVLHEGRRQDVKRPRVRKKTPTGSVESALSTYEAAQEPGELRRRMLEAFQVGVSGRDQSRLHGDNTPGASKSEVSRMWRTEGRKLLLEFRSRDLRRADWLVLMLDGVALEKDLLAVVALGVAADGTKVVLDFELGASESTEVAKGLLKRLSKRGFAPAKGCRLLSVLDGADALRSAVSAYYPDTVFQRCLVHKERNLRPYMRRQDHDELSMHFDRLRKAEGFLAGKEALGELEKFLSERNAAALGSLHEAGDDMLGLHSLNVPATLNVHLLSTNLIENPFRNVRRKTGRVCRWRKETDQASCWLSYALSEAEKGFRRLRNFQDLGRLHKALRRE